jgi:Xaa-Pro dipeptidase
MTRTFFYKKVNEEQKKVYELVKSANESAIAKIKAGISLCELDKTARGVISEAGYGPNFNHRLGHFIGLSEHEFGDVSSANGELAKAGMIFSIEPGIYLEGNFGVRIEDLVLVTEDGVKVLNSYSKELEIIE